MISICIPVYCFDVRQLIRDLSEQGEKLKLPYQILLFDDASTPYYKERNRQIAHLPQVEYRELPQNVGRSAIRNLFLEYAKYEYLIFMDCDSQVENAFFLANYVKGLAKKPKEIVVCGGRSYEKRLSSPEFYLRWEYGRKRECKKAAERNLFPYRSFMTNNFLISRSIFQKISFNTELSGYGHEDTLFGYELKKQKIALCHIDNYLIHIGLENNKEFLDKTTQGITNLFLIYKNLEKESDFMADVKLLSFFSRLKKYKLTFLVGEFFRFFRFFLRKNIESRWAFLSFFDFYKLGLFCFLDSNHIGG